MQILSGSRQHLSRSLCTSSVFHYISTTIRFHRSWYRPSYHRFVYHHRYSYSTSNIYSDESDFSYIGFFLIFPYFRCSPRNYRTRNYQMHETALNVAGDRENLIVYHIGRIYREKYSASGDLYVFHFSSRKL